VNKAMIDDLYIRIQNGAKKPLVIGLSEVRRGSGGVTMGMI
jgi:hypothetical protein